MPTSTHRSITTIACILRAGDTLPQAALQQALRLAAANGAHLSVTIATQHLTTPYSPLWMTLPSSLVAEVNAQTKAKATEAGEAAKDAARIAGVIADIHIQADNGGEATEVAVRAARASDLIVVDQPDAVMDVKATIFEEALFRSGRPVLVATPKRAPGAEINKATLAWDGTSHAARAAADLLSLFPSLKHIDIVSVMGDKDMSSTLPGADMARHLSRKGVHTNIVELPVSDGPVAALLDRFATRSGADILAMGGYGHSRLRQFVIGGVTSSIIQQAGTNLLMSY
ncbi:MAG: universal stress protein [Hyphomicrobiales bacterium]|nr:universal stress protein [Hyphomicrobiales bacterium]